MRHLTQRTEDFSAGLSVAEVGRDKARAKGLIGPPPRNGDHVTARIASKMLHGGIADQARGAGNQNNLTLHANSLRDGYGEYQRSSSIGLALAMASDPV